MKPPKKVAHPPTTASAPETNFVAETSAETRSESNPNNSQQTGITPAASVPFCGRLTQTAIDMAGEYRCSLRTAYRHLARGTSPSSDRRTGRDGKTYPAHPRGLPLARTPLARELALTRQALNRANVKAARDGVDTADIVALHQIVLSAQTILKFWEAL
jgi:hypothetical protein